MPEDALDLVDKLLRLNPLERFVLTDGELRIDYQQLKSHPFFDGINFTMIMESMIHNPLLKEERDQKVEEEKKKEEPIAEMVHVQAVTEEIRYSETIEGFIEELKDEPTLAQVILPKEAETASLAEYDMSRDMMHIDLNFAQTPQNFVMH